MSFVCDIAAPYVANSAVDQVAVTAPFRGHSASCLRCQARYAAMSRAARTLAAMAEEQVLAPPDLEWRVMSSLEGDLAVDDSWQTPLALTAAAVSVAAFVLLWRVRPRPAG